ncbi:hypothetical protein N474_11200 [Pseudoalteromonas luteoviolacea CPMOR-2]|uniref:M15 family metallopeptidase n=1 Tax=Pseudoalteromonas luteoviolacea TaxID=43657 RepID=UPI0007B07FF6|nr:M15 family metallopeptidase [Pseudoalteromonas luteoviolacea]KZN56711.1 hypothetical protein N474_11200 [Pseudoalteromonas luteoviolacea CPMOR-2]
MTEIQLQALGLSNSHLVAYHGSQVHAGILTELKSLNMAAKSAGFEFTIASAHRDFHRQKAIWNAKYSGQRPILNSHNQAVDITQLSSEEIVESIMLFSALPGASRHHFGTDLDIYAKNCLASGASLQLEPWEYQADGPFYEFSCWLEDNLARYGFYKPYDQFRGGVAIEPWHISHVEFANNMSRNLDIAVIADVISKYDVLGKDTIIGNLNELYQRFVINVASTNLPK